MRRAAPLWALVALLVLNGCSSDGDDGTAASPTASTSSGAPSTAAPPPPAPTAPAAAPCEGSDVVDVSDADGLQRALDDARPGQVIRLADGRYEGNFSATVEATADAPILLCGSRAAVLDGGPIDGDYTLHLDHAAYWQVVGFTVSGGQKGVMVDDGTGNRIQKLLVTSMGDEAIHLRRNSTGNAVVGNTVRDTGLRKPKFGEGVYIGTAESNWCDITDCEPDHSDGNLVEGNDIAGTTSESVDIKEGTTGGVVRDNTFDGSALAKADSWVDVKGNDWTIEGNTGTSSPQDGFQVHEVVDGWGHGAVFSENTVHDVPGHAVNVAGPRGLRASTTVACDNSADGAADGLSNVACRNR
jgi:hypothetical protein